VVVESPEPGHDALCERGRGSIPDECHCHSRTFLKDPPRLSGMETPWGLFGFEREHPDTRGHEKRSA
jgi:hypothetical protein